MSAPDKAARYFFGDDSPVLSKKGGEEKGIKVV